MRVKQDSILGRTSLQVLSWLNEVFDKIVGTGVHRTVKEMYPVDEIERVGDRGDAVDVDAAGLSFRGRVRVFASEDVDLVSFRRKCAGKLLDVARDSADDPRRVFPR
jgi:hypothetical protein